MHEGDGGSGGVGGSRTRPQAELLGRVWHAKCAGGLPQLFYIIDNLKQSHLYELKHNNNCKTFSS